MCVSALRRFSAMVVLSSLTIPALPLSADERRLRCESNGNRYQFCEADTDRRVELVQPLSNAKKCVQGYTWGFNERGVWVDRGCRAEFLVGRNGMGTGAKVGIGAAVGAAILGAVIATRANDRSEKAPGWLVGTFRGHNYLHDGAEIEVTIDGDGKARGFADGDPISGQFSGKSRLVLEGREYDVRREGTDGIFIEELKDRKNNLFLWRVS